LGGFADFSAGSEQWRCDRQSGRFLSAVVEGPRFGYDETGRRIAMNQRRSEPLVIEFVTDPVELAKARAQDERFKRNWDWFTDRATEFYRAHRGKYLCISGQQLFVGDTPTEAVVKSRAAHPDDDGRFTRYIPLKRTVRIYAH
jgi:hypothetical protein